MQTGSAASKLYIGIIHRNLNVLIRIGCAIRFAVLWRFVSAHPQLFGGLGGGGRRQFGMARDVVHPVEVLVWVALQVGLGRCRHRPKWILYGT